MVGFVYAVGRRFRWAQALACLMAMSTPAWAQENLDLDTALGYALKRNRNLVRLALSLEGSQIGVGAAESEFSVRVAPDGDLDFSNDRDARQYGLLGSKRFILGTDVQLRGDVSEIDPQDGEEFRRGTLSIRIEQPLFRNFGRLIHGESILQAQQTLKTARRTYHQQMANLIVDVVQSFETILLLEGQIRSDEAFFVRMDKLYKLTRAREKQGHTSRVDTLRVELDRGQALSRLEVTRERLSFNQREFAELLGFDPETIFLLEPPRLIEFEIPALEESVKVGLANRMDYAQVLQDHEDTYRGIKIARRGLYPDLGLVTRYERFGEGRTFSEATDFGEDSWFVGLGANVELNPVRDRAAISRAVVDEKSARETIQIVELNVAREIQQQVTAYRRAQADLRIVGRNLKLSEDRAKLARRLFEAGRGDNFSVTDAEESYLEAESRRLAARAEASVSGYRLLRALGTLIDFPKELKPKAKVGES